MQNWKKLAGPVFLPEQNNWWMLSHASNPVAWLLDNDLVRVFFSSRAAQDKAYLSYIDIELSPQGAKVKTICKQPLLEIGQIGAFDDSGLSMGCLQEVKGQLYLYYLGWNLSVNVPFRNAIGLAIKKKEIFERFSEGPILDRSIVDPYSLSYPFILKDEGIYKMWYGSHKQWGKTTNDMKHHIKYATSKDGIHWKAENIICIPVTEEDYAFSKPCVLKEEKIYKMWYSYRGENYRIGYAESKDGLNWVRKDSEINLDVSKEGWDSEMICYPFVFDFKGDRYMLYNGNGYGKTGFGLALLGQ